MKRLVIAVLLILAATLLVVGGITASWWTHSSGQMRGSIGLRAARLCGNAGCSDAPLGKIAQHDGWIRTGTASYAAALLAGGLLLAVAFTLMLRRHRPLLTQTTLVAVVGAGVAGLAFVWLAPAYPGMDADYSMFAYFAGVLAAAIGCVLTLRAAPQ